MGNKPLKLKNIRNPILKLYLHLEVGYSQTILSSKYLACVYPTLRSVNISVGRQLNSVGISTTQRQKLFHILLGKPETRDAREETNMMIKNLTPHTVTVIAENNDVLATFEPEGVVARAGQISKPVGDIGGIEIVSMSFSDTINLPEPQAGVFLIVSVITLDAAVAQGRTCGDLLMRADPVRNESGQIIGCRRLATKNADSFMAHKIRSISANMVHLNEQAATTLRGIDKAIENTKNIHVDTSVVSAAAAEATAVSRKMAETNQRIQAQVAAMQN